jgi:hypothetical protein
MGRTKKRTAARACWLGCLLLVLALVPASPVGAGPGGLGGLVIFTATPNPIDIPFGTESGTTTITWNSGSNTVPELWVPDRASHREMRLPGITTASGSTTLTLQMGQSTTVSLYTPGHSVLLAAVTITTQHPSGNGVSALPTPLAYSAASGGYFLHPSLQPSYISTREKRYTWSETGLGCSFPTHGTLTVPPKATTWDTITVGYGHYYNDDECMLDDAFWRGAVQFDLSPYKNYHFISATLTFSVTGSMRHEDVPASWPSATGTWSAAAGMDLATDNWVAWPAGEYHDYINGDGLHVPVPSGLMSDPTITLDVTSSVRGWLEGAPNNGFVFYGFDEGFPRNSAIYLCNYSNFKLTLHYV